MKKIIKRIIMLGDIPIEQWIEKDSNGTIIWATFNKEKAKKYIHQ